MRTYYAEHREEIIESARRWYANNREHAAATLRRYREENRDKHRSDNRRWRANNLEKARKSANEWRKRNPEKGREVERRRRAAKVGDPYTEDDVLFSYGTVCHLCGEEIDMAAPRRIGRAGWQMGLHVDHVVPIALGGPDCLENVRPAHGLCNVAKGTAIG
jgi:5-methylcytosine-specific restriction endonuclease McrA